MHWLSGGLEVGFHPQSHWDSMTYTEVAHTRKTSENFDSFETHYSKHFPKRRRVSTMPTNRMGLDIGIDPGVAKRISLLVRETKYQKTPWALRHSNTGSD